MITVYKWMISSSKFVYITDENGGNAFISDDIYAKDGDVKNRVNTFTENEYKLKFEAMVSYLGTMSSDSDVVNFLSELLNYKYYYRVSENACGNATNIIKGRNGYGITGINYDPVTNILTITTDNPDPAVASYSFELPVGWDGEKGDKGDKGDDGLNGTDGISPVVDYGKIYEELEIDKAVLDKYRDDLISATTTELNTILANAQDKLRETQNALSGLTSDIGAISNTAVELSGLTQQFNSFSSVTEGRITNILNETSAFSGITHYLNETVNTLSGTVTSFETTVNSVSGIAENAATYTQVSEVSAFTNEVNQRVNIVSGTLETAVSQLTQNEDGSQSVSLSQIRQTADSLQEIVTNDSGVTAAIMMMINKDTSNILINADKIHLTGEVVAEHLNTVDLTINKGNAFFGFDGSGYLANGNISWTPNGDLTIVGGIDVGGGMTMSEWVSEVTGTTVDFSKGMIHFDKNGSGYLANGKIEWDTEGNLTIDANLDVGMTMEEWVDDVSGTTVDFSQGAIHFDSDGSGYLAKGNISWDVSGNTDINANINIKNNGSLIISGSDESSIKLGYDVDGAPMLNFFDNNGNLIQSLTKDGLLNGMVYYGEESDVDFILTDITDSFFFSDTDYNNGSSVYTYMKELYMDGKDLADDTRFNHSVYYKCTYQKEGDEYLNRISSNKWVNGSGQKTGNPSYLPNGFLFKTRHVADFIQDKNKASGKGKININYHGFKIYNPSGATGLVVSSIIFTIDSFEV